MKYYHLPALSVATVGLVICCGPLALSAVAALAEPTVIPLWPSVAPGSEGYEQAEVYSDEEREEGVGWITGVSRPTLTVHLPEPGKRQGTGMVVCPGGGYSGLAIDHEGHDFAKWLADRGIVAAVLKYRHGGGKHKHPIPLNDAQRALRIMRSNAEPWGLKLDQIGIGGFSAGGHLASTAGTSGDEGDPEAEDPIDRASSRANFMVLVYPVISMQTEITHSGSRDNLLGKRPAAVVADRLSNELQVAADTGPTFLAHAADDPAVVVENSLRFFEALRKHNVPAELHVYTSGGHGFGMFRRDQPADRWPGLLEGWLKAQKLINQPEN